MRKEKMKITKKIIVFLSFLILLICSGLYYSRYIATTGIKVKEYKITNKSIPDNFHGAKIIHISDIHYKTTYYKQEVQKLVVKINKLKPDIVVLTGDLLDKDTKYKNQDFTDLTSELAKINASISKYAITGNHDTKYPVWETIIKESGFINLNDTYDIVYKDSLKPILISGVSSNLKNIKDINNRISNTTNYITSNSNKEGTDNIATYKILLIHEPDYVNNIDYNNFDLILAGHSHNGQVRIPFVGPLILPVGAKKYYKPYYKLNNTDFYISSGLGTSTYPYRLFNRPSFNLYRITNK